MNVEFLWRSQGKTNINTSFIIEVKRVNECISSVKEKEKRENACTTFSFLYDSILLQLLFFSPPSRFFQNPYRKNTRELKKATQLLAFTDKRKQTETETKEKVSLSRAIGGRIWQERVKERSEINKNSIRQWLDVNGCEQKKK